MDFFSAALDTSVLLLAILAEFSCLIMVLLRAMLVSPVNAEFLAHYCKCTFRGSAKELDIPRTGNRVEKTLNKTTHSCFVEMQLAFKES